MNPEQNKYWYWSTAIKVNITSEKKSNICFAFAIQELYNTAINVYSKLFIDAVLYN